MPRTIEQIRAEFEANVCKLAGGPVEVCFTPTQFSVCGSASRVATAVVQLSTHKAWTLTSMETYTDDDDDPTFTVAVFRLPEED
jgi:hypothetical protein